MTCEALQASITIHKQQSNPPKIQVFAPSSVSTVEVQASFPQCIHNPPPSCFSKFSRTNACTTLTNFPTRNKIIALRKEKQISFQFLDIHMHLEFGKQDKMGPDYISGSICWGCYSAIFFHMIYL